MKRNTIPLLLSSLLAFSMVLLLLPGTARAADSGTCGDNLTWTYADGVLTIQGTGEMDKYNETDSTRPPWFEYFKQIHTVNIGDGVTSIGKYAFAFCDSLTNVSISNTVTTINDMAFVRCTSLTSINIPNSVTTIKSGAFGESGLISVTIPDSVTSIENAFVYCHSLTSVTLPNSITSIPGLIFGNCESLTSVDIPNSVTSIEGQAFAYSGLTNLTIPNSVTTIGDQVFQSCENLTSVTIPSSVTSIGNAIFAGCLSLTDIYYGGSESQWEQTNVNKTTMDMRNPIVHYNSSGPGSTPTETVSNTGFTDVAANSAFAPAISWAVEKGITTGKTSTTFAPNENCSKGQILTFLWRANGSRESILSNPFTDSIPASFQKAAIWAYDWDLEDGGIFGSDTPCTRSMVVTYLWQLAGKPTASGSASFPDVASGAEYAQAVAWAVERGITTGKTDGTFAPNEVCTRGQIVTFIYRYFL